MIASQEPGFGPLIRERRRQLNLSQEAVGCQIGTSTAYVGHLESGKRHPSDRVVNRLAEVLGLNARELFLLANPRAQELFRPELGEGGSSAWEGFQQNEALRRVHSITDPEMEMLSRVALLGEVSSPRDFIYILNTVRHAVGR